MSNHSREKRYEILFEFVKTLGLSDKKAEEFRQWLVFDYYLRENPKKRPAFAGEESLSKEEVREFYDKEIIQLNVLEGVWRADKRKIRKMTHLERINGRMILFDYQEGKTWNSEAKIHIL